MITPELRRLLSQQRGGQAYGPTRGEVRVMVPPEVRSGLWSHPDMRCRVTVTAHTGSGYGYKR
jgi:hypothetical protein